MTRPTRTTRSTAWPRRVVGLLIGAAIAAVLPACAPIVVGGAMVVGLLIGAADHDRCAGRQHGGAMVGGALIATDRRTTGTQVEDQSVELKAPQRIAAAIGDVGHVTVTSYNLVALITGEVPTEAHRTAVGQAVARIENVRSIVNELAVAGNSSLTSRSSDSYLTGRVKAAFIDVPGLDATAIKVVTERGTTYLMGRVTEAEAARATEVARSISGVQKVVRVFEIISEAELAALQGKKAPSKQ
jgi:osmotically-inducible protein OsmY